MVYSNIFENKWIKNEKRDLFPFEFFEEKRFGKTSLPKSQNARHPFSNPVMCSEMHTTMVETGD